MALGLNILKNQRATVTICEMVDANNAKENMQHIVCEVAQLIKPKTLPAGSNLGDQEGVEINTQGS